ncbi:hypothetical protein [Haloarcula salinisoli]|uniref:Uncharacterized protein n=1 Tax=Haloarcula salinisoli TaxID=2487746 RepID=A0A8J7YCA8_9EURY|nr:hypothetical protein [Halomicroarcula salinisoli]MBX0302912.1 hypothetical protein [Halomicroarcula salinisoli]
MRLTVGLQFLVFLVPGIGFSFFAIPTLLVGPSSPLLSAAVYAVGTTVTAALGLAAYRVGNGTDTGDIEADAIRYGTRTIAAIGIGIYAPLAAAVGLFIAGIIPLLAISTLIPVSVAAFKILHGGRRPADRYRSPTDEEAHRIRNCFEAFDSSPGTSVVFSLDDNANPKAPAVFVTNSFGQRLTYVHEELLDVATDDELAVAFAQATHRSPFANLYTVANQTMVALLILFSLATVNTLALQALDIGITAFQAPLLPLVLLVTGLLVCIGLVGKLSQWSFAAADDFASRHLGITAVRRTYRALGGWLIMDGGIDHDDSDASGTTELPLARRLDRLGGDSIEESRLADVTYWSLAIFITVCIWVGNLLLRPVALAADNVSGPASTWLVGPSSALFGVFAALVPLLVVYSRRGSPVDSLPASGRTGINTRWEFPVVVVCSLLVIDLVVNGSFSLFWLCLTALLLIATGLSYRDQYLLHLYSRYGREATSEEIDRLQPLLDAEYDTIDEVRVYRKLWPWDVFVTGDDTHRTLHVATSLFETGDDSHLAVAIAEGYERGRELTPNGRFLLCLWVLCALVLGYAVELALANSGVAPVVGVAGLLLLPVILFYNRRYAAGFYRIDSRLCERFGSDTVREAFGTVGSHIERKRSSTFTWRTGLAPHPPIKARLARLPDSDNR